MAAHQPIDRDTVFVAGGQPSVTYVEREQLHIERNLARALAAPNQIVSLAGPTKCGKAVLCRRVLGDRTYVWIDGGQIKEAGQIWGRAAYELNEPNEKQETTASEIAGTVEASAYFVTGGGSRLKRTESTKTFRIDSMASAIQHMMINNIVLVVT